MNNIKPWIPLKLMILISLLLSFRISDAQQQNAEWPFYLAFEDATGARDTIWMLYDESATAPTFFSPGLDSDLGEIPMDEDSTAFKTWIYLDNTTTKYNTNAIPWDQPFQEQYIYASNYELPITVFWDTTYFTANVLMEHDGGPINWARIDNQYLFMTYQEGNWDPENGWDMTIIDHVELPAFWWGSQTHFPLFISISLQNLDPSSIAKVGKTSNFSISPNPATEYIQLNFTKVENVTTRIYDISGKLIKQKTFSALQTQINLNGLKSGLYFVEVEDENGKSVRKLVVNR